jgi:hypothetical protein
MLKHRDGKNSMLTAPTAYLYRMLQMKMIASKVGEMG